ncbi:hypothetical protein ABH935_003597 [Catenulispora sp. GAS73]|uniref:hypothetical protein n=1 Tax=Catenulispora sp. GAS73 TaxID=3156269 RepID=UPI003514573F
MLENNEPPPDTRSPDHEQLDILGFSHAQLSRDERYATWRAYAAPLTSGVGAVVEDPDHVALSIAVIGVFADHPSSQGLTFAQITSGLRQQGVDEEQKAIERRLNHLHREGFLLSYLPKLYQGRYVIRPAGLVGGLAAERVAEHGGVDELMLLLDRTRTALSVPNPDPVVVLKHLNSCRHALTVFAMDLQRRVATGTSAELIEAGRQHDHTSYTRQVADLNSLVTRHFSGHHDLEDAGTALIEAELLYRAQVRSAIGKVLAHGRSGLDFDVLTPREYEDAAVEAGPDALSEVGRYLVADAPPIYLDVAAMMEALEGFSPRSRGRIRPAEPPAPAARDDPLTELERAADQSRRHRQLGMEALLAGRNEVDLTATMQTSWETAVHVLSDAMALDADPNEPFVLHIAEEIVVDRDAPVSYLHPTRLIRTDGIFSYTDSESADTTQPRGPRDD